MSWRDPYEPSEAGKQAVRGPDGVVRQGGCKLGPVVDQGLGQPPRLRSAAGGGGAGGYHYGAARYRPTN